ncbi:MAG: DUF1015 domain-containing protein [Candidatus Omnitrophica bacterium]|nr:DUF1015 domain-containing protein [Candidatus Omnitrophota bacterium]MBL7210308.1 DUF1015 domain-containing protein [Candidatus Omnitrophota bacterium]
MAEIKPFRGVIYNKDRIKDLSAVVCPPYDVISAAMQQRYYELSPYNFVRLILRKDIAGEDKYNAAGDCFRKWFEDGVFIQDKAPAIYFYSLQYKIKGQTKTRLGFIALLRLEDKNSRVLRHEHTRPAPKEDRLKLLRQVRATLSPIFVVFLDKKRIIPYTYDRQLKEKEPFIRLIDEEQNIHQLWRIDSPQLLENLQEKLKEEDIFIADGHHRYEVACAYRDQMKQGKGSAAQDNKSFNYIMAYFTNTDPRGLSIFPINRLLKQDTNFDYDNFMVKLREYFDEEEVKERERFFFLMEKGGCQQHVLGMYGQKKFRLLRLKNVKILDTLIPDQPREVRSLDISILNQIILKKVLGMDSEGKENLEFNPSREELIEKADNDPSSIAFFLNPVKIQEIIAVSLAGERMPAKSTYFYPKALSGLLINKLE